MVNKGLDILYKPLEYDMQEVYDSAAAASAHVTMTSGG